MAAGVFLLIMVFSLMGGKPQIFPELAYEKPFFHSPLDFSIFGYSPLGEKMYSLMAWGYWQSVAVAILGRSFAVILSFTGLAVAWLGGKSGNFAITRLSESLMTIPSLLLALSLGYLAGEGFHTMILVIAISEWSFNQKWLLGRLNEYKRFPFVTASESIGAGKVHIFNTHFLPSISSDIAFLFFLYLPGSLLTVTALEFLGLSSGSTIPGIGSLIALNKDLIFLYPHIILPPIILVILTVYIAILIKRRVQPGVSA